jgi:hypothetical protein
MNDQYHQPEHVKTMENDPYHSEPEKPVENDLYQPEPEKPVENVIYQEETIEASTVTTGTVQDAASPADKTEPWKAAAPAPVAQMGGIAAKPEILLLGLEETEQFRARWKEVQAKFVDEPRSSVEEADALVNELMTKISQMIAGERSKLESQWNEGEVSTENLRQILQSYRSFFNRLLK